MSVVELYAGRECLGANRPREITGEYPGIVWECPKKLSGRREMFRGKLSMGNNWGISGNCPGKLMSEEIVREAGNVWGQIFRGK